MLDDFLEISIEVTDILASMDFYERLGFQPAPVNDVWTHPYAVVTDGHVYLGLHQYAFPSPALSFVQPHLRRQLPQFEALGIKFEFCKLGEDVFNEAGFYDPDRQMVTLLEARTFSPMIARVIGSLCGYFDEYRLPVRQALASQRFWEQLGLISTEPPDASAHTVRLATGGLDLGLWETNRSGIPPQLIFLHAQPEALAKQLEPWGIPIQKVAQAEGASLLLTAPEGTQLLIIRDDS